MRRGTQNSRPSSRYPASCLGLKHDYTGRAPMRSIVWASLTSRLLVVALAVGLLVVGIIQLRTMPVDVLPEFNAPSVEVQTEALGLSAEEVEQLITLGLEHDLLNGVPWLKTIHSK